MLIIFIALMTANMIVSQLPVININVAVAVQSSNFSSSKQWESFGIESKTINVTIDTYFITSSKNGISLNHLCSLFQGKHANAMVIFGNDEFTSAALLLANSINIPAVGRKSFGLIDNTFKVFSRLYVEMNPTLEHFILSVVCFMKINKWVFLTVIIDDTLFGQDLKKGLQKVSDTLINFSFITIMQNNNSSMVYELLSTVHQFPGRLLMISCNEIMISHLVEQGRRLDMLNGQWLWLFVNCKSQQYSLDLYPLGSLQISFRDDLWTKQRLLRVTKNLIMTPIKQSLQEKKILSSISQPLIKIDCYQETTTSILLNEFALLLYRNLQNYVRAIINGSATDLEPQDLNIWYPEFVLENLIWNKDKKKIWHPVGILNKNSARINSIIWPDKRIFGPEIRKKKEYRIVTCVAPPFVMISDPIPKQKCLQGIPCLVIKGDNKNNIVDAITDYKKGAKESVSYNITCCYGFIIDLLINVALELDFRYTLFLTPDGYFGALREKQWNGIMRHLTEGAAHFSFATLSVTSQRAKYVDFTTPFYYSGVSFLTSSRYREVPLLAFLYPFSLNLWIAIFIILNITAIVAAVYEWSSPFGLNPWGRKRTKNFSIGSALWVMWSLLFSHLVAFKAPKSWPNKVLINLWGAFSVIFLASYTANIAALFAGLLFQTTVRDFHDKTLLTYKVGTVKNSAPEFYIYKANNILWQHMTSFMVNNIEDAVSKVRSKELDLILADTPILDYYRGTDQGCILRGIADESINDDSYAIAFQRGLPELLKESVSRLVEKYSQIGYLDDLHEKWFGSLHCTSMGADMFKPRSLEVSALAGVFLLLGIGIIIGCAILICEHYIYKCALPVLRKKKEDSIWKSRQLMFFSQKLYRFINVIDLVSPHHSAKELAHYLRTGHITGLFQKSFKNKEDERKRRRKSKALFFQVIREARRLHLHKTSNIVEGNKQSPHLPNKISVDTIITDEVNRETDIESCNYKRRNIYTKNYQKNLLLRKTVGNYNTMNRNDGFIHPKCSLNSVSCDNLLESASYLVNDLIQIHSPQRLGSSQYPQPNLFSNGCLSETCFSDIRNLPENYCSLKYSSSPALFRFSRNYNVSHGSNLNLFASESMKNKTYNSELQIAMQTHTNRTVNYTDESKKIDKTLESLNKKQLIRLCKMQEKLLTAEIQALHKQNRKILNSIRNAHLSSSI